MTHAVPPGDVHQGSVLLADTLACGVPPDALGPTVDPASLVALPAPVCQVDGDRIRIEVLSAVGLRTGTTAILRWNLA